MRLSTQLVLGLILPVHGVRLSRDADLDPEVQDPLRGEEPAEPQQPEVLSFKEYTFQPGGSGFSVSRFTGQVECVGYKGQAFNMGVQNGWWVHKVDHFYPYSEWRLGQYVNGSQPFSVVFSNVKTTFNCVDWPTNWKDTKGRTCQMYKDRDYCTSYGAEGRGWPTCARWNVFCKNRNMHFFQARRADALSACCQCGGGWDPEGPTTSVTTTVVTTPAPVTTTTTSTTTEAPTTTTQEPTTTAPVAPREPHGGAASMQLSALSVAMLVVAALQ